jgi:iron complex outermembrane recepter protein
MKLIFIMLLLDMLPAYSTAQVNTIITGRVTGRQVAAIAGLEAQHSAIAGITTPAAALQGTGIFEGEPRQPVITGRVSDLHGEPLSGATIIVDDGRFTTISDAGGWFSFPSGEGDSVRLVVSFVGFRTSNRWHPIPPDGELVIRLEQMAELLEEISIINNFAFQAGREEVLGVETAGREVIFHNRSGSLMSSIRHIPGLTAVEIGSGHSKPLVRGLGFNRIVVVENGIRHEAQQWGADHGLEIDQYAVERIEVLKGPASVMYGSDAIGGVLRIHNDPVPVAGNISGDIEITGRSNNNLVGGSASLSGRSRDLFFTSRFTMLDYADYRVPADSVEIYSFHVPLSGRRLRNTAGNETNLHASAGIVRPGFIARISASRVASTSGFFANAHGLEPRRVNTEIYDRSDREILFPSQRVNHYKVTGNLRYEKGNYRLETEMGYQNNFRQEKNHYVNHGYMPAVFPAELGSPPFLEREFNKDIFSLNARNTFRLGNRHNVSLGVSGQHQENRIGGYAFIIPEFRQTSMGIWMYDRIRLGDRTDLHAGVRLDHGIIKTEGYRDWFPTPVMNEEKGELEGKFHARADPIERRFNSSSLSIGLNHSDDNLLLRVNLGKGYRMPTPKELAANGVNYHYFRYEKGDPSLEPEQSWQMDLGFEYPGNGLTIRLSPFFNYFPGYIYLNPSYRYDFLYGAGNQIFEYTRNRVMRFGGEVSAVYKPFNFLSAGLSGDYVYSEQLSGSKKGFTIPFSPPPSARINVSYVSERAWVLDNFFAGLDIEYTWGQRRIVPPERESPSYELVHLTAGGTFFRETVPVEFNFRVHNLFNRSYLNHVSYYRLIGAPEAGRNFILSVKVPLFGK